MININYVFAGICVLIFVPIAILVWKLVNWVRANLVFKNVLVLLIPVAIATAALWFGITS